MSVHRSLGFTLLETLLAILLGSICTLLCTALLLNYHKEHKANLKMSEEQSAALFAQHILSHNIVLAGYTVCGKYRFSNPIRLLTDNNGNSIVKLQKVSADFARVLSKSSGRRVSVNALVPRFKKGDELLLTNCQQHVILRIKQSRIHYKKHQQTLIVASILPNWLNKETIAARIEPVKFYLANSRVKDESALFEENFRGRDMELVPGIESMRVHLRNKTVTVHLGLDVLKVKFYVKEKCR